MSFCSVSKGLLAPVALLLFGVEFAFAHPTPMSSAKVDVYRDRVEVEMRVMVEDFVTYYQLEATEDFLHPAEQLIEATGRHLEFLEKYLFLRDGVGDRIIGRAISADTSDIPGEGVYAADLMSFGVTFKLEYPVGKPPKYLNISQQFAGHAEIASAVMDLAIFQAGVWTQESLQLGSGQYHIAKFDWENPLTESPRTWQERTDLRNAKQLEMLGITSFTTVYSFVYVSERELRHELLVPLALLKNWISISDDNYDFLELGEQPAAKEKISEFVRKSSAVEMNGEPVAPEIGYIDFHELDARDFGKKPGMHRVSVYNDRVAIVLRYPVPDILNSVKMAWNEYNDDLPFLKSIVKTPNEETVQHFFIPEEPTFEWNMPGESSSEPEVVRGEEFSVETAVKEVLPALMIGFMKLDLSENEENLQSRFVNGDSLVVRDLSIINQESTALNGDGPGFLCACEWTLIHESNHWGHFHRNEYRYEGSVHLVSENGVWKINTASLTSRESVNSDIQMPATND